MTEFPTPGPIAVTIKLSVGEVRIAASDRADTVVEVRPSDPGRREDVIAAEQTAVEFALDRLQVRAPRGRRVHNPFRDGGAVDVEIALPAGSRVTGEMEVGGFDCTGTLGDCRLRTAVGDLRVHDTGSARLTTSAGEISGGRIAGDAELITGTSPIHIGRVDGAVVVKSSNGDVHIGEVGKDAQIKAANGDIVVERALASVTAKTAKGDVRIGGLQSGSVEIGTAYGEIEIGIGEGTAAWLDLNTHFGHLRNALDEAASPRPGERAVQVRARTSFGDIAVVRSASAGAEALT